MKSCDCMETDEPDDVPCMAMQILHFLIYLTLNFSIPVFFLRALNEKYGMAHLQTVLFPSLFQALR